jgi:hypothetical protein
MALFFFRNARAAPALGIQKGSKYGERQMFRAEECRVKAEECDEKASEVRDAELMHMFANLANHWRRVADQAERYRDSSIGGSAAW